MLCFVLWGGTSLRDYILQGCMCSLRFMYLSLAFGTDVLRYRGYQVTQLLTASVNCFYHHTSTKVKVLVSLKNVESVSTTLGILITLLSPGRKYRTKLY